MKRINDLSWIKLIGTIIRARKYGLLRLRPVKENLVFECLGDQCGLCCKLLYPTNLEDEKILLLPNLGIQTPKTKSCSSHCVALKEGLCSVYASRPKGCIEYPWYNIDGKVFYDLGCPGFSKGEKNHPKAQDLTPIKSYYNNFPNSVFKFVLFILQIW